MPTKQPETAAPRREHGRETWVPTLFCKNFESLRFAAFDHPWVLIKRVDDGRCRIVLRVPEMGVGAQMRQLANFITLAADFYESESRLPSSREMTKLPL